MIIPSIDLMNGKAVQLKQGKEKVLEKENVIALALEFRKYGEIAVIDLDAAFGKGNNLSLIKKICSIADCRVGGGINSIEKAEELLKSGAKKIIIGTKAKKEFLKQLPKERIIVAIDSKENKIAVNGWKKKTNQSPEQAIKELEDYCSEFLFTDIKKEGLMKGIDLKKIKKIKKLTKNRLTAAGGITSIKEIKELEGLEINSQIGMSLYTGKIKLSKAFISLLDFRKNNGLIPTIVQDERKQVLMLAFSSKESLKKTFESGKAAYYSRSRKKIWVKGNVSGNCQKLIKARYDCDRDSLLFTVKQKNAACHKGSYSCFEEKKFSLNELYGIIKDRIENPAEKSFTSRISESEQSIKNKIKEESNELVNYTDRNNLIWEVADLVYFTMILMAKNNVSIKDIKNELWSRRK